MLQVAVAKKVYMQHARGPATEKYMAQLEKDCDKMWKGGRQLCEAVSLTGSHCVNEVQFCQNPLHIKLWYSFCVELA